MNPAKLLTDRHRQRSVIPSKKILTLEGCVTAMVQMDNIYRSMEEETVVMNGTLYMLISDGIWSILVLTSIIWRYLIFDTCLHLQVLLAPCGLIFYLKRFWYGLLM